ncbi:MAG: Trk system potassium transporter TrkA [Acidobacteriota bacterium]
MRILIAGGGQVGALIAGRLVREGNEVVIVEQDADRCQELEEQLDVKVVRGHAASVLALREAGIADAEMLIAVTNVDEINLLACMVAQVESRARVKVARLRTHEVELWRRVAERSGLKIDLIIHPETDVARRIMRVMRLPGVSDVLEFAGGQARLFGMNVEPNSWLAGKTLEELDRAGPPKNSLIVLIFRGQQVIIPHGAELLLPGDHIYTMATRDNLEDVLRFMGVERQETLSRVFIIGGKQIGIGIAEMLEEQGVHVKLFEIDARRCEKIAAMLNKTIVIHGDGTDQTTLEEENISDVDAFLALTHDDEANVIASLLARRLGAKKVVALINRLNYLHMVQRLGVNTTVSPRLAAVDRILQFVRKARVLSVTTFREEEAEAIELIATEGKKYVGKKLRDIRFPRGAIVGAIARPSGEVIVPRGEATIQARDRVIFFALESVVPELESAFLVEPTRESA